jgi:crotonobetainyl-CoA:carnitine CoA-transferase CaiB-like acyl-CoA transferase
MSGRGDDPPVAVGAYVVDAYTAMLMVGGILAALHYRNKTGKGQWIQIDMLSAVLHMLTQEATYIMNVDPEPRRSTAGIAHVHQPAPYGIYETKNGSLAMSLGDPNVVEAIAKELDIFEEVRPYLSKEALRIHRDSIASAFARVLKNLSTEVALQRLSTTGVWCEPVRQFSEVLYFPEVTQSGMIVSIETEYGGTYRTVNNPLKFSETPTSIRRPAPAWGEHTNEVLEELGYSATEVEKLISEQAAYASRGSGKEGEHDGQ